MVRPASSRNLTVYIPDVLGASREQADFPAEQPSACQDPRLPAAHAHPCGPRDFGCAAAQGPQRTLCLSVLPAAHRMRRSVDFERAVRRGVRAGRSTLVVHLAADLDGEASAQVGFVVSRAVGNAVARNAVKRRLRAATCERLTSLPAHARVVVRALPAAASAAFDSLDRDLGRGLETAVARWTERAGSQS